MHPQIKILLARVAQAVCAAFLLAAAAPVAPAAPHASEWAGAAVAAHRHYGAIFQIDHGGRKAIKKTLNNIKNLLNDPRLKGHITVELIANSRGFDVYTKGNDFEKELRALQRRGVILAQCRNTLRELHIARTDLYPFITIVSSGVGEIAIREAEGWAYIHPSAPPQF